MSCYGSRPLGPRSRSASSTRIRALLAEQAFTDEGRFYVKGQKTKKKCSFAYLENPESSAEGNRLRIRARFTGRSATDLFGRCAGVGSLALDAWYDGLSYSKTAMPRTKVAITLETQLLDRVDELVARQRFRNRSQAIGAALTEKLQRLARTQLARECARLDPKEEKALA